MTLKSLIGELESVGVHRTVCGASGPFGRFEASSVSMRYRDVAIMDEDGYMQIVGRIKDIIIRGGENIYPAEIEQFLYRHPKVADVQVRIHVLSQSLQLSPAVAYPGSPVLCFKGPSEKAGLVYEAIGVVGDPEAKDGQCSQNRKNDCIVHTDVCVLF